MQGKMSLIFQYIVLLFILSGFKGQNLKAQISLEQARESLRDLKGIAFEMEKVDSLAEIDGLKKILLETDVVVRLNQNDIPLIVDSVWEKTPGHPYLLVSIRTMKIQEFKIYFYSLIVALYQDAKPIREPSLNLGAKTWEVTMMGYVETSTLMEEIRTSLLSLIDIFIEDYWAVNGS